MERASRAGVGETRRDILKLAVVSAGLGAGVISGAVVAAADEAVATARGDATPWYRRTLRWGQTNITEADIERYDIAWWRQHWKRTHTQGVLINSGGIVAYYPSKFPLHYRAAGLGDRDLFGELAAAAREEGLMVIARMDSNRTHED